MAGATTLDHRDFRARRFDAEHIDLFRCMQCQEPGPIDLDSGVRDPLYDHALFGQGFAECHARPHPRAERFKRAFRLTDEPHAVMDAARTQPHVFGRNVYVDEIDLGMAVRASS